MSFSTTRGLRDTVRAVNSRRFSTLAFRLGVPAAIVILCASAVLPQLAAVSWADVKAKFDALPLYVWVISLLAAAVSYLAMGLYDVIWHQTLRSGVAVRRALFTGAATLAVSQTTGFGALVATAIRIRIFSHLRIRFLAYLSLGVTVGFTLCYTLILGVMWALNPDQSIAVSGAIWIGLAVACAACVAALLSPGLQGRIWRRLPSHLPSLAACGAFLAITVIDLVVTCISFTVFLPDASAALYWTVLPVFVVAFGAGLFSNAPAGVGPFEYAMLALLPQVPLEDLTVAYLGFRVTYFFVPAVLGFAYLSLKGGLWSEADETPKLPDAVADDVDLDQSPHAEAGLVRQGDLTWLAGPHATTQIASGVTANTVFTIGGPAYGSAADALDILAERSASQMRYPLAYKICPRTAVQARAKGWHVRLAGWNAVLNPATFTLDGPGKSQLRRKLRQATKAGVTVEARGASVPCTDMAALSDAWVAHHGGERGITTGRFAPGYVAAQQTFVARRDARLVAFATFHATEQEWTLDLMRSGADLPQGTMHLLVATACAAAKEAGVARLNLAGVPYVPEGSHWQDRLQAWGAERCSAAGLRQFKASFDPKWDPTYAAAPSKYAFLLGAWELSQLAAHPPRLLSETRHKQTS